MKKIIYLSIVIFSISLTNVLLAQKTPKRKTNFDGNVTIKKTNSSFTNDFNKVILTITSTNNNTKLPDLIAGRSGYFTFFDAKFDEKSNKLAVVYFSVWSLVCDYYKLQDNKWILLNKTSMYFNLVCSYCTEVKLVDMNTIEITLEGQSTNNKIGEIKTYPITINDNYEIEKINGKKIDNSLANSTLLIYYISTEDLMDLKNYSNILYDRLKEKAKKIELTEEEKEVLNIFE